MRPSKIVSGQEPEKTNEFLQILAISIMKQVCVGGGREEGRNEGREGRGREGRGREGRKGEGRKGEGEGRKGEGEGE